MMTAFLAGLSAGSLPGFLGLALPAWFVGAMLCLGLAYVVGVVRARRA